MKIEKTSVNEGLLTEEVRNLIYGVGEGFVEQDYYAPARYYSSIPGVKNIRFGKGHTILVKILTPSGYLLPDNININNIIYHIVCFKSSKFSQKCNY